MNEQDLMIQEKIKKREKMDIMLAYGLIVILLLCILFVVYLKFIKKADSDTETSENPTEYVVNYISLTTIANNITTNLSGKYSGIAANASDTGINVSYGDLLYSIKLVSNELEFTVDHDNEELSRDIYREIISSVCIYYHEDADGCKNASSNVFFGSDVFGVRFLDDTIYINISNSVTPSATINKTVYGAETITGISDTDYEVVINGVTVSNINVENTDTGVTISGDVSGDAKLIVSLYDADDKVLDLKDTSATDKFSITFDYSDKLSKDSVKKYSINVE